MKIDYTVTTPAIEATRDRVIVGMSVKVTMSEGAWAYVKRTLNVRIGKNPTVKITEAKMMLRAQEAVERIYFKNVGVMGDWSATVPAPVLIYLIGSLDFDDTYGGHAALAGMTDALDRVMKRAHRTAVRIAG